MRPIPSLKEICSTNNIIPIVSLTISGFIVLVIFIFFNYSFYLNKLETVLKEGEIESKKMQLNSELMELARTRTRLTAKIIDIEDPFKQDTLREELEDYAGQFATLRQQLISLPLSAQEKDILETHKTIIPIILPSQRNAVENAIHGSSKEAQRILYDIVLPGQGKLVASFQKLISIEQKYISELSSKNQDLLKNMQQRNNVIIISALVIVITLSIFVLARIYIIQNNIRSVNNKLEQANINLEQKVEERTQELSILNKKLKDASEHDELTNIYNRRKFNDFFENEYVRTKRLNSFFALLIIDIDNFKEYNDNYGHQKGDDALVLVASTMSMTLPRSTDFIARYGGEEFVVILPATEIEGARKVAENLRHAVEDKKISHAYSNVASHITISIGLTIYHARDTLTTKDIIKNADQCLYAAKAKGRNQTVVMS